MWTSIHEPAKRNRKVSVTSGPQWQRLAFWVELAEGPRVRVSPGGATRKHISTKQLLERASSMPPPCQCREWKPARFTLQCWTKPLSADLLVSREVSRQTTLQMWSYLFKNQWFLSLPPFNSPAPVKKIHSFKETEWTLNKEISLFSFLPWSSRVCCGLHVSPFHWSLIWLWSRSPSKSTAPRSWWQSHLHCGFGTEADVCSLKKDMKPGPPSSGSLCWHFLKLQRVSNTRSHNFRISCSGFEFQSFSAAVLVWMLIK